MRTRATGMRPSLTGRGAELALLRDTIAQGGTALVAGPPGIGKTALVQAAIAEHDHGAVVLRARATELEALLPFGIAQQLLGPLARSGTTPTGQRRLDGGDLATDVLLGRAGGVEEQAAIDALTWLALALADEARLVVVIDDAQWADEPSLRWLHHLALRTVGTALALVVVARDPVAGTLAGQVLTSLAADATTIALAPLDHAGVAELAAGRVGHDIAALREATGGVPLLVVELLRDLERRGPATHAGGLAFAPVSLRERVAERLARLGPEAESLAVALAILDGAQADLAPALAGLDPAVVPDLERGLVGEGLLDAASGRLAHPVLLRAVLDLAGPARRAAAHRLAAQVLHEGGADAGLVAAHLQQCAPIKEPWAFAALRGAAASAAGRGAPEAAAGLLRRALGEAADERQRAQAQVELAGAMLTAGDLSGADHLLAVADTVPPEVGQALCLRASLPLALAGQAPRVVGLLDDARVNAAEPDLAFAMLAQRAVAAFFGSGEPLAPLLERSLDALAHLGGPDDAARRTRLSQLAFTLTATNASAELLNALGTRAIGSPVEHAQAAAAGAAVPGVAFAIALAQDGLGAGGDGGADAALQRIDEAVRRRGALRFGLVSTLAAKAFVAYGRGDLRRAEADARLALAVGAADTLGLNGFLARAALGHVLVDLGDLDALDRLELPPPTDLAAALGWLAVARGRLARGDAPGGLQAARDVGRLAADHGISGGVPLGWREVEADALLLLGRRDEARATAVILGDAADATGLRGMQAAALRLHGLAEDDGPTVAAATVVAASSMRRLEHARCLLDLGGLLRRAGQRREARRPLLEALGLAQQLGATALAGRATTELRAAGARPRSVLRVGVDALTASERRVADLVAEGRSNREVAALLFVSPKTVESQLRSVFRKLDVTARDDLAPLLRSG